MRLNVLIGVTHLVPLMMAYVTRYIFGTDKLRRNAFEVRGLNGARTGVIHCDDTAILSQWLKYIADNITSLTYLQVVHYKCSLSNYVYRYIRIKFL